MAIIMTYFNTSKFSTYLKVTYYWGPLFVQFWHCDLVCLALFATGPLSDVSLAVDFQVKKIVRFEFKSTERGICTSHVDTMQYDIILNQNILTIFLMAWGGVHVPRRCDDSCLVTI